MIVCPNCNHPNPEGAQACEACYTPLPATTTCPSCGTPVQTDARFCGQCGFDLRSSSVKAHAPSLDSDLPATVPDLVSSDEFEKTEPLVPSFSSLNPTPIPAAEAINSSAHTSSGQLNTPTPQSQPTPEPVVLIQSQPTPEPAVSIQSQPTPEPAIAPSSKTQLQQQKAKLLHVQTNNLIELPQSLSVIHIGKPNDRIPPDVDVAGFPNSEIVSRIHADIRIEGDAFYLEDVGSSNGTYVNNMPLPPGNRHRLRVGDRIALGKGDLVTFLFQLA